MDRAATSYGKFGLMMRPGVRRNTGSGGVGGVRFGVGSTFGGVRGSSGEPGRGLSGPGRGLSGPVGVCGRTGSPGFQPGGQPGVVGVGIVGPGIVGGGIGIVGVVIAVNTSRRNGPKVR